LLFNALLESKLVSVTALKIIAFFRKEMLFDSLIMFRSPAKILDYVNLSCVDQHTTYFNLFEPFCLLIACRVLPLQRRGLARKDEKEKH